MDEGAGAAVQRAREAIWMRYPNVNTWGAYQCYGDPGFRLFRDGRDRPRRSRTLHSPAELITEIRNYTEILRMNMADQRIDDRHALEPLRDFIAAQHATVPEELRGDWFERADVAAAIGFARGEVGGYQEAITWLDKALSGEKGVCPIQAVEQYNNFRVRLCGQQWAALQDAPDDQDKEDRRRALISIVETSMRELDLLCQRAATTERLNLLGSACKRLAWLETEKRGRLEALINMMSYYGGAHDKAGKVDPYPFTNWAVATILVARLDPDRLADWKQPLLEEIEHMIETARERNRTDPNFWNTVAEADCEVARLLIEGVDENSGHISDLYRAAFEQGTSPRQIASVKEHLDFIIAIGDGLPSPIRDAISAIRAAL